MSRSELGLVTDGSMRRFQFVCNKCSSSEFREHFNSSLTTCGWVACLPQEMSAAGGKVGPVKANCVGSLCIAPFKAAVEESMLEALATL